MADEKKPEKKSPVEAFCDAVEALSKSMDGYKITTNRITTKE